MNTKVFNSFKTLEDAFCQICTDVDGFMVNILEWADELGGIVKKQCRNERESSKSQINNEFKLPFHLPKTPSERKARTRKPRNALVSKCSVLNSTVCDNEVISFDDTISTRTRAARRAASKISQFSIARDRQDVTSHDINEMTRIIDKSIKEFLPDATYVLTSPTSTRTKPVLKKKLQETIVSESTNVVELETTKTVSESTFQSPEPRTRKKKISRNVSQSPELRPSKENISRIFSKSPEARSSKNKLSRTVSKSPEARPSRKKQSRSLSSSPEARPSRRKISRTASESRNVVSRTPSKSPVKRSRSKVESKTPTQSPIQRLTRSKVSTSGDNSEANATRIIERSNSMSNRTITIKREATPKISSTSATNSYGEETEAMITDDEKTPKARSGRLTRLSKTLTPVANGESTPMIVVNEEQISPDEIVSSTENLDSNRNCSPGLIQNSPDEEAEKQPVPKKKRKLKNEEESCKENIEDVADGVRITRTKSKAIKQMMEENENKKSDLVVFAKKSLNKAKITSLKKSQLATLLERNTSTPQSGSGKKLSNLAFGTITSKSKYHLLLSNSKKLKTPLATLPNSVVKTIKASSEKDRLKPKVAKRDSSIENVIKTASKPPKDDLLEKEMKLKSKKEKEEEAAMKRQNVIKTKQEELKRKNELKHQLAMKQREKLEQEKYNNIIQSEKEKEERHKLILQERQIKLKEEAFKKKMLTQQKIAETVERRRLEEEARIAKLKEIEAEEQRIALEKQKEQERLEKRAQERLAEKKAREEYEMQLKQELEAERLKAGKLGTAKKFLPSASKLQSASKRQKFGLIGGGKEWDYKPRNENDYGLEDEHSEVDSEDERNYSKNRPPMPWGKRVMSGKSPLIGILTLDMIGEYMPCYQKTPDIYKMFKMTPSKRIKRTSSAIWTTPTS